jgi:hypothetical protein
MTTKGSGATSVKGSPIATIPKPAQTGPGVSQESNRGRASKSGCAPHRSAVGGWRLHVHHSRIMRS